MRRVACLVFGVFVVFAFLVPGQMNRAQGQQHYCGIYSVYSIARMHGVEIDFRQLLETKYVSSYKGSSGTDLLLALKDAGIQARLISGLGVFDLRVANEPLILHVRPNHATKDYSHWVVYCGDEAGEALILDAVKGVDRYSYTELLSLWDGIAIATTSPATGLSVWRMIGRIKYWLTLIFLGCVGWLVVRWSDRLVGQRPGWTGGLRAGMAATVFMVIAFLLGMGLDILRPESVLRASHAKASIASVHLIRPMNEIDLAATEKLYQLKFASLNPVVFVDARFQPDYENGRIEGAINMPIDGDFASDLKAIEQIPSDSEIVIYCQSKECAFAAAVSQRLQARGFRKIQHFTDGFAAWDKAGLATESNGAEPAAGESSTNAESEDENG